ncbi:HAD family hydrolase [Methylocapsa sp. S129]|uniref:HAD family hydrolase n=1 Tax=Methylocapsa sp. S129 TaxID=1641869 RepID=UPI00131AB5EF|nr:HAD family hydrolase [Methylocapsa sp. S129]
MSIAAVLFDKDGTLIDFDGTWGPAFHAVIQALAKGDESAMRAQADALHFSLEEKRFRPTSPIIAGSSAQYGEIWGQAIGRDDYAALRQEIDSLSAVESLKALAPIGSPLEALAALSAQGLRLGVATNDSEASARRHVEALGLLHIEFIAGYDSGHGGKPEPGMVLAFARHLGMEPRRIAMVGDSIHDLHAARAAGALAVAVLSGPAPREELAPHADHIVEDIGALPAFFAGLAASS